MLNRTSCFNNKTHNSVCSPWWCPNSPVVTKEGQYPGVGYAVTPEHPTPWYIREMYLSSWDTPDSRVESRCWFLYRKRHWLNLCDKGRPCSHIHRLRHGPTNKSVTTSFCDKYLKTNNILNQSYLAAIDIGLSFSPTVSHAETMTILTVHLWLLQYAKFRASLMLKGGANSSTQNWPCINLKTVV